MITGSRFAMGQDGVIDVSAWEAVYSLQARIPAKKRLAGVLGEFKKFVGAYLEYFNTDTEVAQIHLPWLIGKIDEALDAYWTPLARIAEQYSVPLYQDIFFDKLVEEKLDFYLAQLKALLPSGNLDIETLKPLLYFDKVSIIYRYPYTNTVFVGMPYHLMMKDWSLGLQAIPHEVGHYLYWNMGKLAGDEANVPFLDRKRYFKEGALAALREWMKTNLQEEALQQPLADMLSDWFEEIFADVVGAKLGGKDYLASTHELLSQSVNVETDLVRHDEKHPSPCFRPFIVAYTSSLDGTYLSQEQWNSGITWRGHNVEALEICLAERIDLGDSKKAFTDFSEEERQSVWAKIAAVVSGKETIQVSIKGVREALTVIVDYIHRQINLYKQNDSEARFGVRPLSDVPTFEELLKLAKIRQDQTNATYQILLRPQFLEGRYSYSHKHDAWSLGNEEPSPGYEDTPRHKMWTYHSASTLGTHGH